jgi:hypothetical protein
MATLRAGLAKVRAYRAIAHHLAGRRPARSLAGALDVGVQDTPPGSGPLALAARVEGVDATTWETERVASRNLVVSWSLRGAPFGHRPADHGLFSVAARPTDDASWLALLHWTRKMPGQVGMSAAEAVDRVAAEVDDLLGGGPMTKTAISTALRDRLPDALLPWCEPCQVHHVSEQVLRVSALSGRFVYGAYDGDRFTLVRTGDWLDRWEPPTARVTQRLRRDLLRRFLAAYGPADGALFAEWLGVGKAEGERRVAEAVEAGELVPVSVAGGRSGQWLDAGDAERFRAVGPADAKGVRLLPASDPWLQQRDRDVIAGDPARRKLIWSAIGGPGVVVVDGAAAGTWRSQRKGDRLTVAVKAFVPLTARVVGALDAEAEVVAAVRGSTLAGVTVAD